MKKTCVECGDSFSGRADAKFCSDQCRSNHHNKKSGSQTAYMRSVNTILRKNRNILQELNPDGKARTSKTELLRKGFDFGYITSTYLTKTGKEYKFCYDQGYIPTGDDWYTLVVKYENI